MEKVEIQLPKIMVNILKGFATKKEIDFNTLIVKWLDEKICENARDTKSLIEDIKAVFSEASIRQIKSISRLYYDEGYKKALDDYAIWKDGVQVIGCMETPIKEIIAKIDAEENDMDAMAMANLDDSYPNEESVLP